MALVLLAGVGTGWLAYRVRLAGARREAVESLRAAGGLVSYWDEFPAQSGFWVDLARRTGWNFAREVAEVDLGAPPPQPPPAPGEPDHPAPPSRAELFRALGRMGRIDTIRLEGLVLAPEERAVLAAAGVRRLELAQATTTVPPEALAGLAEVGSLRSLLVFVERRVDPSRRPALPGSTLARVGASTQLRDLAIDGFGGPAEFDPTTLGRLGELRSLDLRPSPRVGAFLDGLGASGRLETLILPTTRVTDDQLRRLVGRERDLQTLCLNGSLLTDAGAEALAGLARLERLTLGGRPGSGPGITDAGLVAIGRIGTLQGLGLTCGRFEGQGLGALAGSSRLQGLDLGEFVAADPAPLARLLAGRRWRELGFRGPGIDDAILRTILASVGSPNSLDLTFSGVTDAGLAPLAAAPVGFLTLSGTAITPAGLASLAGKTSAYQTVARGMDFTAGQSNALETLYRGRGIALDLGSLRPEDE